MDDTVRGASAGLREIPHPLLGLHKRLAILATLPHPRPLLLHQAHQGHFLSAPPRLVAFATAAGLADAPSLREHGRRRLPATVRLGGWHPAVHVQVGPHGSPGPHAPLLAGVCGGISCVCNRVCAFVRLRHGEGCLWGGSGGGVAIESGVCGFSCCAAGFVVMQQNTLLRLTNVFLNDGQDKQNVF